MERPAGENNVMQRHQSNGCSARATLRAYSASFHSTSSTSPKNTICKEECVVFDLAVKIDWIIAARNYLSTAFTLKKTVMLILLTTGFMFAAWHIKREVNTSAPSCTNTQRQLCHSPRMHSFSSVEKEDHSLISWISIEYLPGPMPNEEPSRDSDSNMPYM